MNKINILIFILGGVQLFLSPAAVWAQQEGRVIDFSRSGHPTMMIYVWGTASTPGIWKVEQGVDLIELLSAAQVPNFGNTESNRKQRVHLRIYRPSIGRRIEIFESDMKKLLKDGKSYPDLQEGDIVLLETVSKQRFNLQTLFAAIGAAASVVLLIIRLDQLSK